MSVSRSQTAAYPSIPLGLPFPADTLLVPGLAFSAQIPRPQIQMLSHALPIPAPAPVGAPSPVPGMPKTAVFPFPYPPLPPAIAFRFPCIPGRIRLPGSPLFLSKLSLPSANVPSLWSFFSFSPIDCTKFPSSV